MTNRLLSESAVIAAVEAAVTCNGVSERHIERIFADDAIAAIKALPDAMAWQPIETALRDGTDFLVNCKEVMSDCTMASYKDGVLVSSWNGKPFSPDVTPPTHWMPLPPAPEQDA